jgi:predicted nucleic acid-binding protein
MSIVVSDTSPIRALHFLRCMELLEQLFGEVYVPEAVHRELLQPTRPGTEVDASTYAFITIRRPADRSRVNAWLVDLDPGESEALALAEELSASTILIDEADGRAAAEMAGFLVTGTLGVLARAKRQGLLPAVAPLLDCLRDELGFYMTDLLRNQVLRLSGE